MDCPNINLNFQEAIVTERNKNEQHELINIVSSGLHTIHGAFKSARKIKKILKGAYCVFDDSPGKREDYTTKTRSTQFPQYFCGTRCGRLVTNWIK